MKLCAIEFCRLNANVKLCADHQEEWQRSPEFRRSQEAEKRGHHTFSAIHWTAVDDFVRRLAAEKRNSK